VKTRAYWEAQRHVIETMTYRQMMDHYNISRPRCYQIRHDLGIAKSAEPRTDIDWDGVRGDMGIVSDTLIAEHLGVSRERVRQVRDRLGIDAPPTGQGPTAMLMCAVQHLTTEEQAAVVARMARSPRGRYYASRLRKYFA